MNLSRITTWIFDLDGVIWRGDTTIEGAISCVAKLRARGGRCLFASNNSTRSPESFAEKLGEMGIDAAPAEIVTSTSATIDYLRRRFPTGARVFVVGEYGLVFQLQNAGFEVMSAEPELWQADAVVVGLARDFTYDDLALAQQQLLGGALFIATNRDATFPVEGGVQPGAGSIVAAVATASGREPLTMGKPEPAMLAQIREDLGLQSEEMAMIGDRLDTDIACAHRAGMGAIWVATGVIGWDEARNASGEEQPDLLLENLDELVKRVGDSSFVILSEGRRSRGAV